jgi:outer membrane usher protein
MSDYAFSLGKLRRDYGLSNFSYGPIAASGAWRQGLTDWFTIEAQAQAAPSLTVGGAGGVVRVGNLGVVDASAAIGRHEGETGAQVAMGYQYNDRRFNVALRHVRRGSHFTDLGGYGVPHFRLPRRETQAHGSFVLGHDLGTFSAHYVDTRRKDDRSRFVGLTYAKPLWRRGNLVLAANRDLESGRTSAMLQFVVSLGRRGVATAGFERDESGRFRERINYSRSVPTDGGIGWNAGLAHGSRDATQYRGDVTWRMPAVQLQAGAYGGHGQDTLWGDVSGSLVLMGGGAFAANRINDAFVVVSTDGVPGIPIRQENQRVGVTDKAGLLLVPWVNAYYGSKFGIDPLDLPPTVSTPIVEQRAAVKLGSGRIVRFPVRSMRSATLVLRDQQGRPLPAGTPVTTDGGLASYVGWDGIVYFEGLSTSNRITANLANGGSCDAEFSLPAVDTYSARIGPLTCQ